MVVISVSFHQYLCAQPSSQKERALGGAIAPLIRAAVLPLFSHHPSRRAEAGGATAPSASQFHTITAKPLRTDKGYVAYASHPHA
jgi:hypothetical protein